jgi:hypothetical protein
MKAVLLAAACSIAFLVMLLSHPAFASAAMLT